ncbi:phosphoribosylanthranilate isomerase [Flavisphingomonas formosensis]|uniref:phosphoribosylanthranilate isomerase n=1 Tax=Flavisphingomonas formosensis TaxID=861534 RepID=UPI0012FAC646|nr:phosphoribosylanthranilate isomerase [Sphingomonas formosensis]
MSRITAKICGLSTLDTLDAAIGGGASHVGFVFFPKSPRNVTPEQAGGLAARVPAHVARVGLFVDPDPGFVAHVLAVAKLDVIQLHGAEPPELLHRVRAHPGIELWKAIPVRTRADLDAGRLYRGTADRLLYDAKPPKGADLPGGNGLRFDWKLLNGHSHALPWALSGGLDTDNIAEAVGITGARLVDISSGVESAPGVKDVDKIAGFLQAVARL